MIFWLKWPGDIGPLQWYRISLALEPQNPRIPGDEIYTNPSGTLLTVTSEQYGIDENGEQFTQFTIRNDSNYVVPAGSSVTFLFTVNVLSSPSRH
jgi:hypothetical protein